MDLFKIREELSNAGIMICFNGPFSHSIIEEIGHAVRIYLSEENIAKAAVLDVFAIYIELAQNVKNYISTHTIPAEKVKSCIITISKNNNSYIITSGNIVLSDDIASLTASVDSINDLDQTDLKKRYKEQLRKQKDEQAMGAGLGLLEIAKRSSTKLTYQITPMDSPYIFFSLSASV